MSQRIGMADSRCFTDFVSSRIMNDTIMAKNGVEFQDNRAYRSLIQNSEPSALGLPLKNAACSGGVSSSPIVADQ